MYRYQIQNQPELCVSEEHKATIMVLVQHLSVRGGIYDQQDATNSQYLLLEMLYMFRAIIAHHQELRTICAAIRCYKL
jgi:deoxyribodipyrimidine photolyase-like uncharacterized protein